MTVELLRSDSAKRAWLSRLSLLAAGVLAVVWLAAGCDSGSFPVAPSASALTVRASPVTITTNGVSMIEVRLIEGGLPVRVGTQIRFTTNLGSLAQEIVTTDQDGLAVNTLTADGRVGTATVAVTSGAKSGAATVTIGDTALKASFTCASAGGLTVKFDGGTTGTVRTWSWNFGDGGTSSETNPLHTYPAEGTYETTLTVTSDGGQDTIVKTVTLPGGTC